MSQYLRFLKDGGLVVSRAEGTRRIDRLNPDGVTAVRAYLDRVWEEALGDGITGGGGWITLLELFAKAATDQS